MIRDSRLVRHLRLTAVAVCLFHTCLAQEPTQPMPTATFGEDVRLLKEHTDAVVLQRDKAAIVVVPEYQGRVMTATADGNRGASSGWINYDLVKQGVISDEQAKGTLVEHMYAFGGEERFWMGPEGGQYSIFFKPGAQFEFDDWFTPEPIDSEAWAVAKQSETSITLKHAFELQNHSGTKFAVDAQRTVDLLGSPEVSQMLGGPLTNSIKLVAYRSTNRVTNAGESAWKKESGLLSIWMLCMFQPSPTTTVFVPFRKGVQSDLGKIVADDYFGKVAPERLKVGDGVVYFVCDGKKRGKIGFSPERAKGIAGSYDPAIGRLTLLMYQEPESHLGYVNSKWQLQDNPYEGDAINSYNDGPVDESGEQMGPFYELESSSPALALAPGESATHTQTVMHLYGQRAALQGVLDGICDVDLDEVAGVFGQ